MRISKETADQIVGLKGIKTQKAIAEEFGISQGRVSQIMLGKGPLSAEARSLVAKERAANYAVGRKRTLDYTGILEMAEDSATYKEIAEYFGCSIGSVARIVTNSTEEFEDE